MARLLWIFLFVLGSLWASAQQISGRGTFPQYRSISGLPGGGFAVTRSGRVEIGGHAAASTPIAYSLRPGTVVASISNLSPDKRLRSIDEDQSEGSNGTAVEMAGIGTAPGNVSFSLMYLSRKTDTVANIHLHLRNPIARLDKGRIPVDIGFGVQDFLSQGGSSGEDLDEENNGGKSNSPYAVVTAELPNKTYVSGGIGTTRFRTVFANASGPIGKSARWTAEYDGYGINIGAVVQVAPNIQASAALMDNRRAQWSVTLRLP